MNLDFITDPPITTVGVDSILVLLDSLSKVAHFIPTKRSYPASNAVVPLKNRLSATIHSIT